MTIRKVTYNISYIHILTFRENYKSVVAPYFEFEPLRYGIDDENTRDESIRLIFENEGFLIQAKKDGVLFIYEGEVSDVKKNNPILEIYFELYEKIKKIEGFTKTKRHEIITDAVEIIDNEKIESLLKKNSFLVNPFDRLNDFATIYEFQKDDKSFKFQFGNFSEGDIKKYNISPLNSKFNESLKGKKGLMCQVNIKEELSHSSFSKFKQLLVESEDIIKLYLRDGY